MDRMKILSVLICLILLSMPAAAAKADKPGAVADPQGTVPKSVAETPQADEPLSAAAVDAPSEPVPAEPKAPSKATSLADFASKLATTVATTATAPIYQFVPSPESPKMPFNPKGSYATNLFSGSATYSYPIEVPLGTNGMQPSLAISYNSHSSSGKASWAGLGWSLTENYVQRDVNYTSSNTADDEFQLVLGGSYYDLVPVGGGEYRTKTDSHLRIKKLDGAGNSFKEYWLVTDTGGTEYRLGYTTNSELCSSVLQTTKVKNKYVTKSPYAVRWSLDQAEDTSGNKIYYDYTEAADETEVYPKSISYNNDRLRVITFTFVARPDIITQYIQGSKIRETKRLSGITVSYNGATVRSYSLAYDTNAYNSASYLKSITQKGSDGASLPATSFTYSAVTKGWASDSNWAIPEYSVDSNGKDYGVRIVDVNGDGLPDILRAYSAGSSSIKSAWINTGDGWVASSTWLLPTYVTDSNGKDLGTRIADVNGDGLPDVLRYYYYSGSSNGNYAWINTGSGWVADSTWKSPAYFVGSNNHDVGTRIVDVNGDGLPDILRAYLYSGSSKGTYAWINTGRGWVQDNRWACPDYFVASNSQDRGVRIADVNGDGLPDILRAYYYSGSSKGTYAWINTGTGWVADTTWLPPEYFVGSNGADRGVRIVDVNGDGLPDILRAYYYSGSSNGNYAWINTGKGWVADNTWKSSAYLVGADSRDLGTRIEDLNGDGLADILRSYSYSAGTRASSAWISNGHANYVLSSIMTSLGGTIGFEYIHSTALDNTGDDSVADLNFPLNLLSSVSYDNGMSSAHNVEYSVDYEYSGGLYDYKDKEFRGFANVKEISPYSIQEHWFHQDDALKGLEYQTDVSDLDGDLLFRSADEWVYDKENGVYDVELASSTSSVYDGHTTPFVTGTEYEYDQYGNAIYQAELGNVDVEGDEKYAYVNYAYNTNDWIVDKPKNSYVLDSNDEKVSETWYYYDGQNSGSSLTKGFLTEQKYWLGASEDKWVINGGLKETGRAFPIDDSTPSVHYAYDSYGNAIRATDAEGRESSFGYDAATHTFKTSETNAMGYTTSYAYDPVTGNLLSTTDANGIVATATYDAFGRALKEIMPYDSAAYPSKAYAYYLDGSAPEGIKVSSRADGSDYIDSYAFVDGFGNVVQTASDAEASGQQIISNMYYDEAGQVREKSVPYTASAGATYNAPQSARSEKYSYDALGRLIETENTDGMSKTYEYDRDEVAFTDENGHGKSYTTDAYGNIIQIEEQNNGESYYTDYTYDSLGQLVAIEDDAGNDFAFAYDTLGRKVLQEDPDMGVWTYTYDQVGNMLTQTDGRGVETLFEYDDLNRVTQKSYFEARRSPIGDVEYGTIGNVEYGILGEASADAHYYYDEQLKGTLSRVVDDTSTVEYTYDNRYRTVAEEVAIDGESWATEWSYDSADRATSMVYPDSEEVTFEYNSQGQLESVPGIVDNLDYNAQNKIALRELVNGADTEYTYDSASFRLDRIYVASIQDLNYDFDGVGNILQIDDGIDDTETVFAYDGLDRLISAVGDLFDLEYLYDSIGNLLSVTSPDMFTMKSAMSSGGTTRYTYGDGAGPHAVTSLSVPSPEPVFVVMEEPEGTSLSEAADEAPSEDEVLVDNATQSMPIENATQTNTTEAAPENITEAAPENTTETAPENTTEVITANMTVADNATDEISQAAETVQVYVNSSGSDADAKRVRTSETAMQYAVLSGRVESPILDREFGARLIDYGYDANGNVVNDSEFTYEYNSANRLERVLKDGEVVEQYWYDADGIRIKKVANGTTTYYPFDHYEVDDGEATSYYFANSERVAKKNSTGTFFYHQDHLGSTSVMTDSEGELVEKTQYAPFGAVLSGGSERYGYTGQESDATGLMYYNARYYDPVLQRFMEADTLLPNLYDPQQLNRYSYVRNNPIMLTDPSGNCIWDGCIFEAAAIAYIAGSVAGAWSTADAKGLSLDEALGDQDVRMGSAAVGIGAAATVATAGAAAPAVASAGTAYGVGGALTTTMAVGGTSVVAGDTAAQMSYNAMSGQGLTSGLSVERGLTSWALGSGTAGVFKGISIVVAGKTITNNGLTIIGRTKDNFAGAAKVIGGDHMDIPNFDAMSHAEKWAKTVGFHAQQLENGNLIATVSNTAYKAPLYAREIRLFKSLGIRIPFIGEK